MIIYLHILYFFFVTIRRQHVFLLLRQSITNLSANDETRTVWTHSLVTENCNDYISPLLLIISLECRRCVRVTSFLHHSFWHLPISLNWWMNSIDLREHPKFVFKNLSFITVLSIHFIVNLIITYMKIFDTDNDDVINVSTEGFFFFLMNTNNTQFPCTRSTLWFPNNGKVIVTWNSWMFQIHICTGYSCSVVHTCS